MAEATPRFVLASASPRRADLLSTLGIRWETRACDIDETPLAGESAAAMTERLAIGKVMAAAPSTGDCGNCFVLGADTAVLAAGEILGKPVDDEDARRMLQLLSGAEHYVVSGIAVRGPNGVIESTVNVATVWFKELSAHEINWYLATGEHQGKAGAYAIQGAAAVFVERVDGEYNSIVGLPVNAVDRLLARFDVSFRTFV